MAVVADAGTALGSAPEGHDLSGLAGHRLRSHGGDAERRVPFILSWAAVVPRNRSTSR